jgi:polar amino acid transport system substrate-binding protein
MFRIIIFLIGMFHSMQAIAIEIHLAYSDVSTWPYQTGEGLEAANPPGVALDLITQVAQDLHFEVNFKRLPNKRVLFALQSGVIDGAFIYSHNQERQGFARYPMRGNEVDGSRRIARLSYYLYRQKGSNVQWDGRRFVNLSGIIGANAGYSVVADLKKLGVAVEEAKTTEQNFNKLKLGRVAGVAAQSEMTDPFLQKHGITDVEKFPVPIISKDYFLIFSQSFAEKNPQLIEQIWNRIGETRDARTRAALPNYPPP